MPIFDVDIVVSASNVELDKVAGVFHLVHEVGDKGKRVGVAGSVFIKITVVLIGAEFAVFLLDKEERGCLGGTGRTDLSCS